MGKAWLSAHEFSFISQGAQAGSDLLAVIPLDFDCAILYRPTTATGLFQPPCQGLQVVGSKLKVAHDSNRLAGPAFSVSKDGSSLLTRRQADWFWASAWVPLAARAAPGKIRIGGIDGGTVIEGHSLSSQRGLPGYWPPRCGLLASRSSPISLILPLAVHRTGWKRRDERLIVIPLHPVKSGQLSQAQS